MRKILSAILVIFSVAGLSGCQKPNDETDSTTTQSISVTTQNSTVTTQDTTTSSQSTSVTTQVLKIEDYFPIEENAKYVRNLDI